MKLIPSLICALLVFSPFVNASDQTQTFSTSAGPVMITPLTHASTLIQAGGKVIYLDPAKPVSFAERPKADLILITDIHGDHMDPDSIKAVTKAGTEILAPPAVVQTVTAAKPIANGETKTWQDWTIEAIPAYNLKRGPAAGKLFHDKGRGNGYVLTYGGKRFYFSADTEGIPEMRCSTLRLRSGQASRGRLSPHEQVSYALKISSTGLRNIFPILKASGRLGSYFSVSIAFTVCRETPSFSARSA